MSKKEDAIQSANIAIDNQPDQQQALDEAQGAYDGDVQALRDFEVQDYYSDLKATNIDLDSLQKIDPASTRFQGQAGQARLGNLGSAQGYEGEGYSARGTNVGNLQRGSATGLSNVFNNLQVSTAGADMANQEADQALAASQDLAAQAGTGAGGATALAAAAAKSKQGISADIDRQVKANEQMRAQGEQSLQRDQLSQDNLSSNFDLGKSQFNVGQQNTVRSQAMSANNQARQFDATQQNQFAQSRFSAENQRQQFNASQSNAERMAEFGALQNANAANAGAINNALAQNSQTQTNFDLSQAAGNTANDQALYGQTNDILNLSTEQLNNEEASNDALQQIIAAGDKAPS